MPSKYLNHKKEIIALFIIILATLIILVGALSNNSHNNSNTQVEATTQSEHRQISLNDDEQATFDVLRYIYYTLKKPSDFRLVGSAIVKTESSLPLGYIKIQAYGKIRYYTVLTNYHDLKDNISESNDIEKKSADLFCQHSDLNIDKIQRYFDENKPS